MPGSLAACVVVCTCYRICYVYRETVVDIVLCAETYRVLVVDVRQILLHQQMKYHNTVLVCVYNDIL